MGIGKSSVGTEAHLLVRLGFCCFSLSSSQPSTYECPFLFSRLKLRAGSAPTKSVKAAEICAGTPVGLRAELPFFASLAG